MEEVTCCNKQRKFIEEIIYQWKLRKLMKKLRARKEERDATKAKECTEGR